MKHKQTGHVLAVKASIEPVKFILFSVFEYFLSKILDFDKCPIFYAQLKYIQCVAPLDHEIGDLGLNKYVTSIL